MFDIYSRWYELEKIVENNKENVPSFISVFSTKEIDMFIQSSKNRELAILLHVNDYRDIVLNYDLFGIDVKTLINESIDKNKMSIVITNNNVDNINIFKAFSATLYDSIIENNETEDIEEIIINTINDYKKFFSGDKRNLGDLEQQGLFGELSYILEQLNNGNNDVIKYWEGVFKNKHDFVYKDKSVEIKTTKNQTQLITHISNECQLDNTNCNKLLLVVYRLEKVEAGETIYDLYSKIKSIIGNFDIDLFESKLIQSGMDITNGEGLNRYRLQEKYIFTVDSSFPKITKGEISDRIFEVKYYLNLSGIDAEKEVYKYE